jgi:superfamily I DNA/RNA helicase
LISLGTLDLFVALEPGDDFRPDTRMRLPPDQNAKMLQTYSSDLLEVELTRRNIPFVKFGGLKFLEAAHVKDMLALLRFIENPRDRVAGFRLMLRIPATATHFNIHSHLKLVYRQR